MKVAMIGQKGIPTQFGGIERHVEALSVRLGQMGHDVLVYTRAWYALPADRQARRARFSKGVSTVMTPTLKTKHFDAIVHTFTSTLHAMAADVDVIHYHGVGPSLLSWIPRVFAPRIKVVSTFHCIDRKHQKWNIVARLMLGMGEKAACLFPHETIVVSKTLQSYCGNRFNRDTRYVPNGIVEPGRSGTDILAKFGLKKDGYIAMVSRLVRHKGAHYLIGSYRTLQKRGLTGGKKLVIIGDSAFTDDYVKELRAMAAGNPDILFTGYLKGKALDQAFAGAYCVAHPSESEGLPIAVLEAMSYGKTVVASDIPENMEVTREHGVNFKNKSMADLTRKLRFVIDNPKLAVSKGTAAKAFVLAHYQWDDVAKQVAGIYKELVPAAKKARKLKSAKASMSSRA